MYMYMYIYIPSRLLHHLFPHYTASLSHRMFAPNSKGRMAEFCYSTCTCRDENGWVTLTRTKSGHEPKTGDKFSVASEAFLGISA